MFCIPSAKGFTSPITTYDRYEFGATSVNYLSATSPVSALNNIISKNSFFVYGQFFGIADKLTRKAARFAVIDQNTGLLTQTFKTSFNGVVYDFVRDPRDTGSLFTFIYVVGNFTEYNGQPANKVAKINYLTGALSTSFGTAMGTGFAASTNQTEGVSTSALPSSDQCPYCIQASWSSVYSSILNIYIAGNFTSFNGNTNAKYMIKLDVDGYLDTTFKLTQAGFQLDNTVYAIKFDYYYTSGSSWSNLFIGGSFTGGFRQIDSSGNGVSSWLSSVSAPVYAIATNGAEVFVGGNFTSVTPFGGTAYGAKRIVKLNRQLSFTGTYPIDTTFDSFNNGPIGSVFAISDNTNSPIVGGAFTRFQENINDTLPIDYWIRYLCKINSNGKINTTFDTFGTAQQNLKSPNGPVLNIYQDIISGQFTQYKREKVGSVIKINGTTSARITSFNPKIYGFARKYDPRFVCGEFIGSGNDPEVVAFESVANFNLSNGLLNKSFDTSNSFNFLINNQNVDNKIPIYSVTTDDTHAYISGQFTSYKSKTTTGLVKVNISNGEPDNSFSCDQVTIYAVLYVGSNGGLYCGGQFTSLNGTSRTNFAKISTVTGNVDTTFNIGTGANASVNNIISDGNSLYILGSFSAYNSVSRGRLAKINLNTGGLDTTFNTSSAAGRGFFQSSTLTYDARIFDNKFYVITTGTNYGTASVGRIVCINATDGSLINSFYPTLNLSEYIFSISSDSNSIYFALRTSGTIYKINTSDNSISTVQGENLNVVGVPNRTLPVRGVFYFGNKIYMKWVIYSPPPGTYIVDASTGKIV